MQHIDCPIDCVLSDFDDWSGCDQTCGGGEKTRSRTQLFQPQHGGKACASLSETKACATEPCPEDCVLTDFVAWTSCSRSCDTGYRMRDRHVVKEAKHGGLSCRHLTETEQCGTMLCPIDCSVSTWGGWESCSKTCGSGSQYRTRRITMDSDNGGVKCPVLSLERSCASESCPVDCAVSAWGEFSACSRSCGEGWQVRTRESTKQAEYGGIGCPAFEDTVACNKHPCPVDCSVDVWGHFGECSMTCGNGIQKRIRPVIMNTAYGGAECPALDEIRPCNAGPCPTHCTVSSWSAYSLCTVSCGDDGKKTRYRTVEQHALAGGYTCPALSETADCDVPRCPVDCTVSEWGSWSACSKSCGGGVTVRTRHVVAQMQYGGGCPQLLNESPCNTKLCAVDCEVNDWSAWASCTNSCGGGERSRSRAAIQLPNTEGKACPDLNQKEQCNTEECAHDCTISDWGEWSQCGVTEHSQCARGKFRTITRLATGGGNHCPTLSHWEECAFGQCAPVSIAMHLTIADETAETFTAAKQIIYRQALATALGVDVTEIQIKIVAQRRRLLSGGLAIEITISASNVAESNAITQKAEAASFGTELVSALSNEGVSVPSGSIAISNIHSTAAATAAGCSHVSCSYFIRDDGRAALQVRHHNKESNGKKHFCKQEEDGKTCACVCSDSSPDVTAWGNAKA